MARFRTIDPKVWQHPFFRKQPWYVRDVFLFLFSSHADDEGRFVADAFAILEGAFSRNHPVTEEDVEEALSALDNSKLTLRYGADSEYGFLVGWYEHQYIEKARRSESSLPPPPVQICSWEAADQAKANYQEATGRKAQGVYYSDAVRWQEQQTVNSESTERQLDVPLKGREGKGKERNNDLLSETDANNVSDTTPLLKSETAKQRKQRKIAEEQQLLAEFDGEEQELLDDYMACADEELEKKWLVEHRDKSPEDYNGGVTVAGKVSRLKELVAVANSVKDPDAFRYGLHQANRARVPNANYVKSAALSKRDGR